MSGSSPEVMFLAIGSVDINSLSSSRSSQLSLNCIRVTLHVHTDSVHRLVDHIMHWPSV